MVEVFKTNVEDVVQAENVLALLHQTFTGYLANFDLQDCDRILRVKSMIGFINASSVIGLLKENGVIAEVLQEQVGTYNHFR